MKTRSLASSLQFEGELEENRQYIVGENTLSTPVRLLLLEG